MQQLQKTYSLPNCTLVLDGMSDPSAASSGGAMTILTRAVCKFLGQEQVLSGGSDFFNSLVPAVNRYAQEQLSGLKGSSKTEQGSVTIERRDSGHHHLSVVPDADDVATPQAIDLTTVQFFDLVEAIDQFLADRSTLPNQQLKLQPISKRDVPSQQSLSQKLTTPALGAAGLAVAAAALFALEVPELRRPIDDSNPSVATETVEGEPLDPDNVVDAEFAAPPITDADQLASIRETVFANIDTAWNEYSYPTFTEDAVYRLSASADGEIVGYRGVDELAQNATDELPLAKLLYTPSSEAAVSDEPLAQFKVTFTPDGQLSVEPWELPETASAEAEEGNSDEGDDTTTADSESDTGEAADGEADTDGKEEAESSEEKDEDENAFEPLDQATLDELAAGALGADLYNRIDGKWVDNPTFEEDLEFRVTVNIDSDILSYTAITKDASSFEEEIPLADLKKDGASGDGSDFKVVFKTNGILEVTPWEDKKKETEADKEKEADKEEES